jgi:hypothetical protein
VIVAVGTGDGGGSAPTVVARTDDHPDDQANGPMRISATEVGPKGGIVNLSEQHRTTCLEMTRKGSQVRVLYGPPT